MPAKDGDWTRQERIFAREMAKTADAVNAAKVAGYAHPAVAASKLQRREAVMQTVWQQIATRIETTLVPMALATFEEVLRPENAEKFPARVRVDAADKVLKHYRSTRPEDEGEKELHELTAAEHRARYEAERLKLKAFEALLVEAENTIEHDLPSPAEGEEADIFD
ncbi:hypothetical protein AFCDBAGC_5179 [Methylobacterium cerastii]|uniref:Terminase small subunit n=1 Tax=Methylobacterium cerastii TaxID=932741 RepID=A0ABQ4QRE9_9HYPH|nr:hypothetical protein [Methylobacterium cerastii]GJD47286.1 hypothetical protein AFCDBAGC_5179 [Methylobacterium cerastii]